ncbi:cytochrome c nitrite reductase small subunit [bacterium]|nr:cytochrome c nitrite reductase small subunit [bacterium]
MKKIFGFLRPPDEWRWLVNILLGVFVGIGCLAVYISNAPSYLSDKPETCMNCHVMAPQFATWQRSSHARVTVCNDCHVPHDNFFRKYMFKAQDGLRHSAMFTFRLEPQVIHIKEAGVTVVQENCIRCHSSLVDNVSAKKVTGDNNQHGQGQLCWQCHRETPHGRVNSLASVPYARVPRLSPVVPKWMDQFLTNKNK